MAASTSGAAAGAPLGRVLLDAAQGPLHPAAAQTLLAALDAGWADDVVLTYDEMEGYLLKGTDTQGSKLEIKVRYDAKTDSLRLEDLPV